MSEIEEGAQVQEGWEERYGAIRKQVKVSLNHHEILYGLMEQGLISSEESVRSAWKIALLEPLVTRMVVNMIKGTVKYTRDDWGAVVWDDMGMDDKADSINYDVLKDFWVRQRS